MPYAIKQRIDPNHRRRAKPPNNCLANFTHSGVVGGGDKALGPSRSKISAAFSFDRPCREKKTQIYDFQNDPLNFFLLSMVTKMVSAYRTLYSDLIRLVI